MLNSTVLSKKTSFYAFQMIIPYVIPFMEHYILFQFASFHELYGFEELTLWISMVTTQPDQRDMLNF